MKKLLLLLLLAPLFIGCSSDDDNNDSDKLYGTWEYTTDSNEKRVVEFKADGKMNYSGENTNGATKTYAYQVKGDILFIDGFDYLVKYMIYEEDGKTKFRTGNSNKTPPADYPLIYDEYEEYIGENAKLLKAIPYIKVN